MRARLSKLKEGNDQNGFVGFNTRNVDALYFVFENGVFYLDYELSEPGKEAYAEPFRTFAAKLGFAVVDTTYGDWPVLRVNIGDSEARAAEVGFLFAQSLFGHNRETVIEFLP